MPPKRNDFKYCSNPYHKIHSKTAHRNARPVLNNLEEARRVFPDLNWTPESLLCTRCRLKICNAAKLDRVQSGVQIEQQSVAKHLEATLSVPGPAGEVQIPANTSVPIESDNEQSPKDSSVDVGEPLEAPWREATDTSSDTTQGSTKESASSGASSTHENVHELRKSLEVAGVHMPSTSQRKRPREWRKVYMSAKGFLQKRIFKASGVEASPATSKQRPCFFCRRLLNELAGKFRLQKTREEKYKVLTCIPSRYGYREIVEATACSERVARQSKQLLEDNGAYSCPPPKKGRPLNPEVVERIRRFYQYSINSRDSPRANDVLRVRNDDGLVELKHRIFLLDNLSDFYHKFLDENKDVKVSVSKFAQLRPRNCIWPGRAGHHVTCVCEIHENFKFLLRAVHFEGKTEDFIKLVVCNNKKGSRENCYLGFCSDCPSEPHISEILDPNLQDEEISYQVWTHTDATDLQWQTVNTDEFRRIFLLSVPKIIEHEYITGRQFKFMKTLREDNLRNVDEATVQVDFAQNYSFVVQNAVQGYHWSNKQATVHPFVVHWFNAKKDAVIFKTFIVISDELGHDTDTFQTFRKKFIETIKTDEELKHLKKLYYLSDGAGSHYKNYKNFANLMFHQEGFGITAEWHFTATSHGKSTCDAMSAIVKCATRRASILEKKLITTPIEMFNYCKDSLTKENRVFLYVRKEEVGDIREDLAERYRQFDKITATRKHHAFKPTADGVLLMGRTSDSNVYKPFSFRHHSVATFSYDNMEIGKYYAFFEANNYQIGMLVETNRDSDEVLLVVLKLKRKTRVVVCPDEHVCTEIPYSDILVEIKDPAMNENQQLVVDSDDMSSVRRCFKSYKEKLVQTG